MRTNPSPSEIQQNKRLALVTASACGGAAATAIQESFFSNAAMTEMGKRSSRTLPENLASRVFSNVNKLWRSPIKGSKLQWYKLKRAERPVSELAAPRPMKISRKTSSVLK